MPAGSVQPTEPQPFDLASVRGLSQDDVARRLAQDGPNELPASRPKTLVGIALEVVREPMFLLLVAAASIYLLVGDLSEGLLLLAFVLVVMGITLYQQRKTERALEALRDLSSPRALVIRNGERKRIPGRDVVSGDLLMLAEGDRVPADGVLLDGIGLTVDESLLTGESVPVRKRAGATDGTMARPGGDDLPFLYSGTLVVAGQGVARVEATGGRTELGKIGRALQSLEPEATAIERETRLLVRRVAALGAVFCVLVVVVYGLTRGNWLDGLLAGITFAMATLPEEFPVVLTIFLALGAWRLSLRHVLTRRVAAIETLGAATVLCVDKTGTLTLNQMAVRRLRVGDADWDVRAEGQRCPRRSTKWSSSPSSPATAIRSTRWRRHFAASASTTWRRASTCTRTGRSSANTRSRRSCSRCRASGESRETRRLRDRGERRARGDGRPVPPGRCERWRMCRGRWRNSPSGGLRVLGVARASFRPAELPGGQHDFVFEFLGLVGLEDPVRPTAVAAVKECHSAGIRVVMITGDYPGTARNIARQVGLHADTVVTGAELDGDERRRSSGRASRARNVFARVVPEQKLQLVEALKANGEVVAMTGDGVNDAPALKAAHIGIAMGGRGTDVAREAASLVLLDDDFTSIVQAVRLGRRIFDNLKKAMAYIFAIHVPIAGMSLIPVLLQLAARPAAGPHRLPRAHHRSGLLGRVRGGGRGEPT